jgi:flavin reductase (DIM6/NTAB) family NADH-FMN oxidoreductase RutF
MRKIEPAALTLKPFHLLDEEWALLVGGRERPNPMTVSWGGFGTLWNRPMATVYVRPTRHTCNKLLEHREFTLNFLPPEMKAALELCGAKSGRDIDKWAAAGLEPVKSERVAVPRVDGARLVLECRTLATLDFDPARFLDPAVDKNYPKKDYHRLFFGEVLAVWAGDSWR